MRRVPLSLPHVVDGQGIAGPSWEVNPLCPTSRHRNPRGWQIPAVPRVRDGPGRPAAERIAAESRRDRRGGGRQGRTARIAPAEAGDRGDRVRMADTPDSVGGARGAPRAIIHLGRMSPSGSGGQPGPRGEAPPPPGGGTRALFGLASGGACRALPVAGQAVGPYPTVSPLPGRASRPGPAVSSLWRFPSGYPGRALPGAVAP